MIHTNFKKIFHSQIIRKPVFVCKFFTKSISFQKNNRNEFKLSNNNLENETSVWMEYNQLSVNYKPVDLGQGFPDFAPPEFITNSLIDVTISGKFHQYTREFGHPRLVNVLSKLYSQLIDRQINQYTEIIVTIGAYEALYSTILGHVADKDEVIIIEPYFDCYTPMVLCAGGIPKYIPLKPIKKSGIIHSSDWILDYNKLDKLFNEKTKMIIINTPHNPIGKVFSESELQAIADLCIKWNVICVSDEVYEWLVYKPHKHIRIATLPGMWERTITIGSAGKTFCVTGWRLGWAYGPVNLISKVRLIHQNYISNNNTLCQEVIARAFEYELARLGSKESYLVTLPQEMEVKRDYMSKLLNDVGMIPVIPDGGYSLIADWSPLEEKINLCSETDVNKDYRFTKWMIKNIKLLGIPPSAFYSTSHKHFAENYVRYCFIKKDETLKQTAEILKKWSNNLL